MAQSYVGSNLLVENRYQIYKKTSFPFNICFFYDFNDVNEINFLVLAIFDYIYTIPMYVLTTLSADPRLKLTHKRAY